MRDPSRCAEGVRLGQQRDRRWRWRRRLLASVAQLLEQAGAGAEFLGETADVLGDALELYVQAVHAAAELFHLVADLEQFHGPPEMR